MCGIPVCFRSSARVELPAAAALTPGAACACRRWAWNSSTWCAGCSHHDDCPRAHAPPTRTCIGANPRAGLYPVPVPARRPVAPACPPPLAVISQSASFVSASVASSTASLVGRLSSAAVSLPAVAATTPPAPPSSASHQQARSITSLPAASVSAPPSTFAAPTWTSEDWDWRSLSF